MGCQDKEGVNGRVLLLPFDGVECYLFFCDAKHLQCWMVMIHHLKEQRGCCLGIILFGL